MGAYEDKLREHARLAILRFLEGAPRYTSNVSMLKELLPDVGISLSADQIATEARWLEEQGFVTCDEHQAGFLIVEATLRGVDVALGVIHVPGVKRPRPGE